MVDPVRIITESLPCGGAKKIKHRECVGDILEGLKLSSCQTPHSFRTSSSHGQTDDRTQEHAAADDHRNFKEALQIDTCNC